jgi:hypothetical protein
MTALLPPWRSLAAERMTHANRLLELTWSHCFLLSNCWRAVFGRHKRRNGSLREKNILHSAVKNTAALPYDSSRWLVPDKHMLADCLWAGRRTCICFRPIPISALHSLGFGRTTSASPAAQHKKKPNAHTCRLLLCTKQAPGNHMWSGDTGLFLRQSTSACGGGRFPSGLCWRGVSTPVGTSAAATVRHLQKLNYASVANLPLLAYEDCGFPLAALAMFPCFPRSWVWFSAALSGLPNTRCGTSLTLVELVGRRRQMVSLACCYLFYNETPPMGTTWTPGVSRCAGACFHDGHLAGANPGPRGSVLSGSSGSAAVSRRHSAFLYSLVGTERKSGDVLCTNVLEQTPDTASSGAASSAVFALGRPPVASSMADCLSVLWLMGRLFTDRGGAGNLRKRLSRKADTQ